MIYAQIDKHGNCVGISELSGEIESENLVEIESFDNDYLNKKYLNGEWVDKPAIILPLEELKQQKLNEISKACEDIITQGIDLDNEHFSLTQNDQINIGTLYNATQQGAENLLYHADGELCRYFTSSEIVALFGKVAQHKMYHTTYCNHINAWIRRAETAEEINAIQYGDELPADLQEHFNEILGAMTNDG